ncbi:carbohydrate ABC transporter permease [Kribbella italica]|uniref:Putative aldouronate transport system permease protein n=1 Tax=Kribbella italica TaxID=1540520 RepID=A0A7W9J6F2_9ACTN|nr:carbohydrate ABC transporter permease [Kribbella italica]MBB5835783.1 putative aldouronate transport system permease protein [Kribbella italica]
MSQRTEERLPDGSPTTGPGAPTRRLTRRERKRRDNAEERTRIKEPRSDRIFLFFVYLLLAVFLAIVALPLIYILASSFSSPEAVSAGRVTLWPVDFSLRGYEAVLGNSQVIQGYVNSLIYTVAGTVVSVVLTIAIAYPLSRRTFAGRNVFMSVILFTMLFTGGLVPTYLVVQSLGMLDTRWALIIPQAVGVWQVIIARTYFRTAIPDELEEAAQLDGCSDLRFLWSIVIPLAKPMIAVVALMYAILQWNSYFDALIYLKSPDLFPLQLVLRNILILNTYSGGGQDASVVMERQQLADLLKYSLIVVASVPVLVIYPFVARFFTKGIMIGAVKG